MTSSSSSGKRENPDQTPSSQNEGQTNEVISEQERTQGERKEVDVKDYPKAAALAQILKDIEFPAEKRQIVDYVERAGPQKEEILSDIQKIEDRRYTSVSDITKAAGLVSRSGNSRAAP